MLQRSEDFKNQVKDDHYDIYVQDGGRIPDRLGEAENELHDIIQEDAFDKQQLKDGVMKLDAAVRAAKKDVSAAISKKEEDEKKKSEEEQKKKEEEQKRKEAAKKAKEQEEQQKKEQQQQQQGGDGAAGKGSGSGATSQDAGSKDGSSAPSKENKDAYAKDT